MKVAHFPRSYVTILKSLVFVMPLVTVIGCGALPNKYSPTKYDMVNVEENSGTIIISTGADEDCIVESSFLKLIKEGDNYHQPVELLPVDNYTFPSDFSNHHGFVNLVSLPAGDYYFANWLANGYVKAVNMPKYGFTVEPGVVTYLGEYYLTTGCNNAYIKATISNQYERDITKLAAMAPDFPIESIKVELIKQTGWAVKDGENVK